MSSSSTHARVLVVYSTQHGSTRNIAERVAGTLRTRGFAVDVHDVAAPVQPVIGEYRAALLAAPIHMGRHAKDFVAFVVRNRDALARMASALLSVSLTQITLDSATASDEQRRLARDALQQVLATFIARTGWRPGQVSSIAGSLAYTRYNWFVRWMMKRIARKQGGSTDTSRDHVYTDWIALEQLVVTFATGLDGTEHAVAVA